MSKRRDILTAVAFLLRKMNELNEEMGKPGAPNGAIRKEWARLASRFQELMDRFAKLCQAGKQPEEQSRRAALP
jgi:hypothetical protein